MTCTCTHDWHPGADPGVWACACGAMYLDAETAGGQPAAEPTPAPAYSTPPPVYPSLAAAEHEIRQQERERAAALIRAYADTRPAGEAYALLRLCRTIETEVHPTIPAPAPTCATCGHPRDDHPYRHPFQPRFRDRDRDRA